MTKGELGAAHRDKLEKLLRSLTFQRDTIAAAMAFIMDCGEGAEEVTEVLVQALIAPSTPIPLLLARLHLLSDVLHNSGTTALRHAWKYRLGYPHCHTLTAYG